MAKTTMGTRKEITKKHCDQYRKASKKEKGRILDAVCFSTGLSRDRAQRLLSGAVSRAPSKRRSGRKPKYDEDVRLALEAVWTLSDFASGKRLVAAMPDMLSALARFGEVDFDERVMKLLYEISAATADRLLKKAKERMRFRGLSTTKPGTLLKNEIPLRMGDEWNEDMPGYVEIDLVAHCGDSAAGEYVNSLDVTDINSGWTETGAVINKAQKHTFEGLMKIEEQMPFRFLGIDSDNGSEFINHQLYRYCRDNGIVFTRSRPYKKNDNCHVEQKNWHIVRRHIGYDRYEGQAATDLLNQYYDRLRLYTNFFMPQTKLINKTRDGAHVHKTYQKPMTPYRRLLASEYIPQATKDELTAIFITLNPAELQRDMMNILQALRAFRVPH